MYIPKSLKLINFLSHTNTHFEFRQGKAVLVVGQNLDKEGTRGNGAGKSSLNEGISVALTGNSIRNVKPRELVRNGCDVGEVEIEFFNTKTNTDLTIRRTLYEKQSKSSECRIWREGIEVTSCPDINSYNKFILDLFNISKEDLFNFYIITKEQYQPFLSIGDTKKKEIINRFSGADVIDKTEEFIDIDSKKVESEITSIKSQITSCQGKQSVYSEEIEKEKQSISDEEIEKQKSIIDVQIAEKEDNFLFKTQDKKKFEKEKFEKEVDLAKKIKEKIDTTELEQFLLEKSSLESENLNLNQKSKNVTSEFQVEIDEIKTLELECTESINLLTKATQELKEERVQLENQLVGLIECPNCSHQFSLKKKDIVVEEVRKQIQEKKTQETTNNEEKKEYEDVILELNNQKIDINNRITEKRKVYLDRITEINQRVLEITEKENEFNLKVKKHSTELSNLELEIKSLTQKIELSSSELLNIKKQVEVLTEKKLLLDNKDTSRLEELEVKLKEQMELEMKLREEEGIKLQEKQKVDEWYINFKNFKSYLANQSIKNISDYTNFFLQSIGSNITINIEGYRMMSNKKLKEEITTLVYKNGLEEGSYGKFSAGERGRIEISTILAMQELLNLNNPSGGLDLLICDEILDSVDDLGLESILNALQGLDKTIMIVSQNQINSLKENTIIIRKENKNSFIFNN